MSLPTVSVVIATYNYGHFLGKSLDSVLAQTWPDLEVIVVDDGSSDETPSVVAARGDHRVRYIRQERRGPASALNRGLELTRGEFLAMLGADDWWLPEKLERQLELLAAKPEVGLAYTDVLVVDTQGTPLYVHYSQPGCTPSVGWVLPQLLARNFIVASSVLLRRAVWESVGPHEESLEVGEDWDLWLRVAARWQLGYVDRPLVCYRVHAHNIHRRAPAVRDLFRVLERFPDAVVPWECLAAGVRRRAYANAHLTAASLLTNHQAAYAQALVHLARAASTDWRVLGGRELRLAMKAVLRLVGLHKPRNELQRRNGRG